MKMFRGILALVLVVLLGGFAVAAQKDAALEAEVKDFIQKYQQAFQEKNLDNIMAMYTEDAVLLGTGPGERFVGTEEIKDAYVEYFNAFDKEEATHTWHKAGHHGDVMWVSGMSYITSYFKNKEKEFALNWTFVLAKKDGTWKYVQRHISNISCE